MNKKALFITIGIILIVIAAGAALYFTGVFSKLTQPKTPETPQSQTYEGTVLCLPHKKAEDTQTLECAVGLKTSDGTYYGLSGTTNTGLSSAASDQKSVKVTGTMQAQESDTYKMSGIITVDSFSFTDKSAE